MVILPVLFLPPLLEPPYVSDFSGLEAVTSVKSLMTLCLWPGVVGLNFLKPILIEF